MAVWSAGEWHLADINHTICNQAHRATGQPFRRELKTVVGFFLSVPIWWLHVCMSYLPASRRITCTWHISIVITTLKLDLIYGWTFFTPWTETGFLGFGRWRGGRGKFIANAFPNAIAMCGSQWIPEFIDHPPSVHSRLHAGFRGFVGPVISIGINGKFIPKVQPSPGPGGICHRRSVFVTDTDADAYAGFVWVGGFSWNW